jgi:hypothetical protein
MDHHKIALQKYRLALELSRARARGAMVKGDRRDYTVMCNAERDRQDAAKLKPRERVMLDLVDLAEYDRLRERKALKLTPTFDSGRVWP